MNKCYECHPEAYGPYRYWMHKTLCEEHKRKAAEWVAQMAKKMSMNIPVQRDGLVTITTISENYSITLQEDQK